MDISVVSWMKVGDLKSSLRFNDEMLNGRKSELIVRAFVPIENNTPTSTRDPTKNR